MRKLSIILFLTTLIIILAGCSNGGDAIFVSWVEGNTVFLGHSLDGATFEAPITVQETYSPSKQADCIVDHQGNLQVAWSGIDGPDWDIKIRRAQLVED